jgi:uncharacterized protein YggU (UPF0235/DUF167 family)
MYIKVTVTPGARKERIEESGEASFTISVKEPAAQNHANTRVRELLAAHFAITTAQVRILTGHRSRSKMISIDI